MKGLQAESSQKKGNRRRKGGLRSNLVETRLCGKLRDGSADLPQHLLRAEVVAFRVVDLDLEPFRTDLKTPAWQSDSMVTHCTTNIMGAR